MHSFGPYIFSDGLCEKSPEQQGQEYTLNSHRWHKVEELGSIAKREAHAQIKADKHEALSFMLSSSS
jgi:hypothetical protein